METRSYCNVSNTTLYDVILYKFYFELKFVKYIMQET